MSDCKFSVGQSARVTPRPRTGEQWWVDGMKDRCGQVGVVRSTHAPEMRGGVHDVVFPDGDWWFLFGDWLEAAPGKKPG